MTGYFASRVSKPHQRLFEAATRVVARMPDRQLDGEWVRCHEVARATCRLLGTGTVVDGVYGCAVEHSWISLDQALLDPYAVGRLPTVQLVNLAHCFKHALLLDVQDPDPSAESTIQRLFPRPVWGGLYQVGEPRTDIRDDIVDWLVRSVILTAPVPPRYEAHCGY